MSTLFLLNPAKQIDHKFGLKAQSTAHTIRDSASEIEKMSLLEQKRSFLEDLDRQSPFTDYLQKGFALLCRPGWLEGFLQEEEDGEQQADTNGSSIGI